MELGHFLQIFLISTPPHIFRYCATYYVRILEITDETCKFRNYGPQWDYVKYVSVNTDCCPYHVLRYSVMCVCTVVVYR